MQDVQSSADERGIAIQRVGITEAHLPFLIKTKDGDFQQVLARIRFTVSLPQEYKGTLLLVSHEPDFYEDLVDTVWNIESWSTKIV